MYERFWKREVRPRGMVGREARQRGRSKKGNRDKMLERLERQERLER